MYRIEFQKPVEMYNASQINHIKAFSNIHDV